MDNDYDDVWFITASDGRRFSCHVEPLGNGQAPYWVFVGPGLERRTGPRWRVGSEAELPNLVNER